MKKLILVCAFFVGLGLAKAPVSAAAYEVQNAVVDVAPCCGSRSSTVLGFKAKGGESGTKFNFRIQSYYSYEGYQKRSKSNRLSAARQSVKDARAGRREARKQERLNAKINKINSKIN
jgi:hypothetical protein